MKKQLGPLGEFCSVGGRGPGALDLAPGKVARITKLGAIQTNQLPAVERFLSSRYSLRFNPVL